MYRGLSLISSIESRDVNNDDECWHDHINIEKAWNLVRMLPRSPVFSTVVGLSMIDAKLRTASHVVDLMLHLLLPSLPKARRVGGKIQG